MEADLSAGVLALKRTIIENFKIKWSLKNPVPSDLKFTRHAHQTAMELETDIPGFGVVFEAQNLIREEFPH